MPNIQELAVTIRENNEYLKKITQLIEIQVEDHLNNPQENSLVDLWYMNNRIVHMIKWFFDEDSEEEN